MKRFILHKQQPTGVDHPTLVRGNCADYIYGLDRNRSWVVEIKQFRKVRSIEQNAYMHGVPLKMICDKTGFEMKDIKEYLCGEWSGWTEYEMFGKRKVKPQKRTSDMTTIEMEEFLEWVRWWASETLDMYIPEPNEY